MSVFHKELALCGKAEGSFPLRQAARQWWNSLKAKSLSLHQVVIISVMSFTLYVWQCELMLIVLKKKKTFSFCHFNISQTPCAHS